jgi:hypothetical protein
MRYKYIYSLKTFTKYKKLEAKHGIDYEDSMSDVSDFDIDTETKWATSGKVEIALAKYQK